MHKHIEVLAEEFKNDPDGMFLLNYKLQVFKEYPTNFQPLTEQKLYHLVNQLIDTRSNEWLNDAMKLPADLRTVPNIRQRCVNIIKLHLLLVICIDAWVDTYRNTNYYGWKLKLENSFILSGCIPSLYLVNESNKVDFAIINIFWEDPLLVSNNHPSEWTTMAKAVGISYKGTSSKQLYTTCSLLQINEAINEILQKV